MVSGHRSTYYPHSMLLNTGVRTITGVFDSNEVVSLMGLFSQKKPNNPTSYLHRVATHHTVSEEGRRGWGRVGISGVGVSVAESIQRSRGCACAKPSERKNTKNLIN